jgi:hypothetical protein
MHEIERVSKGEMSLAQFCGILVINLNCHCMCREAVQAQKVEVVV